MAWAARRDRVRYEIDDCGAPFGFVYAPLPEPESDEPYIDALDEADSMNDLDRPTAWRCDDCNQRNAAEWRTCSMCGIRREDA